VFLLIYFIALV